jgi:hypothetical protein
VEKNTTIVFPLPVDMLSAITKAVDKIGRWHSAKPGYTEAS